MLAVSESAYHTSRVWTRRRVEQTRLTLGHSNRGVPYPCVVNLKYVTSLFQNGKFTQLESSRDSSLNQCLQNFLFTSVMVPLQLNSTSDILSVLL